MMPDFMRAVEIEPDRRVRINHEIREKAHQINRIIIQGQNPIVYLKETGSTDPDGEWETIRDWMRNYAESMFASIPLKYRLKLPQNSEKNVGKPDLAR